MIRSGVATILCLSFGCAVAFAGGQDCKYISMDDLAGKKIPQFDAFPATSIPGLRPVAVNLQNNPQARRYRTMIRRGAADGPNFAGHFTIVGWGCGSSCEAWAVVDAKSGTVYFPPDSIATISTNHVDEIGPNEPEPLFNGLRFQLNSNLIILLGAPREDDSREGILFYRWTGNTFVLIQAYHHKWCKQ